MYTGIGQLNKWMVDDESQVSYSKWGGYIQAGRFLEWSMW